MTQDSAEARWPRLIALGALAWQVAGCVAYLGFVLSSDITKQSVYVGPITLAIGLCLANSGLSLMVATAIAIWAAIRRRSYRWLLVGLEAAAVAAGLGLIGAANVLIARAIGS